MKQKLLLFLCTIIAAPLLPNTQELSLSTINFNPEANHTCYAYLNDSIKQGFAALITKDPNHLWSENFKTMCQLIAAGNNVAELPAIQSAVAEALIFLRHKESNLDYYDIRAHIENYNQTLATSPTVDALIDQETGEITTTRSRCTKFCKLVACDIQTNTLSANIGNITKLFANSIVLNGKNLTIPTPTPTPTVSGEYAFLYNNDPTGQTVLNGDPVLWANNGAISSGISHTPGSSAITFNVAGTYFVTTQMFVYQDANQAWQYFINGTAIAGTQYNNSYFYNLSLEAIIVVSAGDVLTIRNVSPAGLINEIFPVNPPGTTNSSINITKIR